MGRALGVRGLLPGPAALLNAKVRSSSLPLAAGEAVCRGVPLVGHRSDSAPPRGGNMSYTTPSPRRVPARRRRRLIKSGKPFFFPEPLIPENILKKMFKIFAEFLSYRR